jgi:glycosyltransferase involved in cell wall biosynthesis
MIKLYVNFKPRVGPWGGINSFLKAFIKVCENRSDITLLKEPDLHNTDIFLQSAASSGGDTDLALNDFKEIFKNQNRKKLIVRLDGLRAVYSTNISESDHVQIELAKKASGIIFQSKASLEQFRKFDYRGENYRIIYNGVDQSIFYPDSANKSLRGPLKILAASWSNSPKKGFRVISEISLQENVEVTFVGCWNENTPKNNVKIIEALPQEKLADIYRSNDVFLHAAEDDPCPNVVLEALSCGLPMIYNTTGGTPELSEGYGLPLDGGQNETDYYNKLLENMTNNYLEFREKILKDMKKFSIERASEEYIEYFKHILSTRKNVFQKFFKI